MRVIKVALLVAGVNLVAWGHTDENIWLRLVGAAALGLYEGLRGDQ